MSSTPNVRPELLAPAGDWEALRAAVANGADAVYFGLSNFNARYRATNFTLEELPEVMAYLQARNVRGYVAFNTLVFSDELAEAVRFIERIVEAGADAVIVQDLGLARLIRQVAPDLPIHGSTQMTLTEPRGIEFVRELGVERVILARELSIGDIQRIAQQTTMPLEVFVHGALCVAYSGQCLTSEALGGRSANRGQCAQACRMPYEMVVDGRVRDFGDRAYLLSPLDLEAHELIEPLVKLGVCSFKIEGRLKTAHYVAATSQAYRAAIDAAAEQQPFNLSEDARRDLVQTYSRGFSPGFLGGLNHQQLVPARFPKARGVRIGTIANVTRRGVVIELEGDLPVDYVKLGDGLVIDQGRPEEQEQGGRVYEATLVGSERKTGKTEGEKGRKGEGERSRQQDNKASKSRGRRLQVAFAEGAVVLERVKLGAIVWKTDDPAMRKRLERSYAGDPVHHRVTVRFELLGEIGGSVQLRATDDDGFTAMSDWPGPLERARKHPLNDDVLREQLGRLGDTPFVLGDVVNRLAADAMLPKSVLNELRRKAVERLRTAREGRRDRTVQRGVLEEARRQIGERRATAEDAQRLIDSPCLHVLVRTMEQLDAVLRWQPEESLPRPASVYCDFEDVRRYKEAVTRGHDAGMPIGLATLRIIKPNEEGFLAPIARAGGDFILVRNLAGLSYFREAVPQTPLLGDFSLNVANEITADLLLDAGLHRLVPSYDLNWDQLVAMLGRIDPALFEVVIHQHMPMFHMEHCVFAAMLSTGKDWRDCGRPCDRRRVELRDHVGAEFPLVADTGCRNTVFNSVAQSAAEYVPRMLSLGVRHYRLELLRETADEVIPLVGRYSRVLAGLETGRGTFRSLNVLNQLGVTRGTLDRA